MTVVLKAWLNGWPTARRMRGEAPLSSVAVCHFCRSHRDCIEHFSCCPVVRALGTRHLRLTLCINTATIERLLLFNLFPGDSLLVLAVHLYAVFGCRFLAASDFDRTYQERVRKACSLSPRLGVQLRTFCNF